MIKLDKNIIDCLHAFNGPREVSYRYELLNNKDIKVKDLQVLSGRISFDSEAVIKRTASFDVRNADLLDWLNHRIKAYFRLKVGKEYIEWPLGIFIPSTGSRRKTISDINSIECYDNGLILTEDKITSRYFIANGTSYATAISSLLNSSGIWKVNIPGTNKVISMDKEWEAGTSKIDVVNQLLGEINYTSLWCDENGYFRAAPYVLPTLREVEYEYRTDQKSIILLDGRTEETDLFNTPNRWVVTASNPEKQVLTASYTNSNPVSKTSTVLRGRVITDFRQIDDIADQTTLNSYVEKIAYEASSSIYNRLTFNTPNMPHHTHQDCIWFEDKYMGIANKFIETSWEMDLDVGGKMSHKIRRVVGI